MVMREGWEKRDYQRRSSVESPSIKKMNRLKKTWLYEV